MLVRYKSHEMVLFREYSRLGITWDFLLLIRMGPVREERPDSINDDRILPQIL